MRWSVFLAASIDAPWIGRGVARKEEHDSGVALAPLSGKGWTNNDKQTRCQDPLCVVLGSNL